MILRDGSRRGAAAPSFSFLDPSVFPLDFSCWSASFPHAPLLLSAFVLEGGSGLLGLHRSFSRPCNFVSTRPSPLVRSPRKHPFAPKVWVFPTPVHLDPTMVLVPRQRGWNTYSYPPTNPWAGHYALTPGSPAAASWFSEHLASQAAHAHTFPSPSPSTGTTLTVPATTTNNPTQASTPPAALGLQTTSTTSPTTSLLSLPGETTSSPLVMPSPAASSSFHLTLTLPLSIPSGGGLTVSLPNVGPGSAAQPDPTAPNFSSSSGETAQPVATDGSSANPNPHPASSRMSKGEIAAIALGIVSALGLCGLAYFLRRQRKGRRRDSTFIQYRTSPFPFPALLSSGG